MFIILAIWVLFGFIAKSIARGKNRSGWGWFWVGFFFGPFSLVILFLPRLEPEKEASEPGSAAIDLQSKKCPTCAEFIKLEALKCRHCGEVFDPEDVKRDIEAAQADLDQSRTEAVSKVCPTCGSEGVVRAYAEDGLLGDWCPQCNKSLRAMRVQAAGSATAA